MRIEELIAELQKMDPQGEVLALDAACCGCSKVTLSVELQQVGKDVEIWGYSRS